MTDSLPPELPLVTPDLRRRLAQRYEEAVRLMVEGPPARPRVHEVLAVCVRADPGNMLYLSELLANLNRWQPKSVRSWLGNWLGGKGTSVAEGAPPDELLRAAPELLRAGYDDPKLLGQLASAAGQCQLEEAELVYWRQAATVAPSDAPSLLGLARCLTRGGRFEEALEQWRKLAAAGPDEEATQALTDLEPVADVPSQAAAMDSRIDPADATASIAEAERLAQQGALIQSEELLRRSLSAAGGGLRLHEALESLQLARSEQRIAIAERRAAHDQHPQAQSLVRRLAAEHNRLEIDIFHVRSERYPGDLSLRLELARRLKRSGNFSGAIQRLEEARADERLAGEALVELGECWQHLRQYEKALDYYRRAIETDERLSVTSTTPRPLVGALYRIGVLAAAMNQPAEAKAALARLVAIEPDYKDARQRLDNLP